MEYLADFVPTSNGVYPPGRTPNGLDTAANGRAIVGRNIISNIYRDINRII